ncbi:MAG: nucleotidyl transferase AbiEii/AbiGii toxin family protein [Deltaproteobacteria bacterium]|nr:nucleotidyl transferase AbiEii/AbiGii toxin family protein [Deltaproteobacteria bacterium]
MMFDDILARIAIELKKADLPYMIIGGQAVLLYGTPRMTKDIDITLGVDIGFLEDILPSLDAMDLKIIPEDYKTFAEKTYVLPTKDETSGIRVDFIFSFTPYERQAISNSRAVLLKGTNVMFASAEDVIIHKIFAGRPRDLEDVRSILLKTPELDREYIRKWLSEFEKSPDKKGLTKIFDDVLTD